MITGCIHGRFQPFHNGHFEYMMAAARQCDSLIIGITQYEPEISDEASPAHRLNRADNPFTYWERQQIIRAVLAAAQIPIRIDIVPFPIHAPALIKNFVDPRCVMFTTIYDLWNLQKIRRLKDEQFPVHVLWRRRVKEVEGKQVRAAMRTDWGQFEQLVPAGVSREIESMCERQNRKIKLL